MVLEMKELKTPLFIYFNNCSEVNKIAASKLTLSCQTNCTKKIEDGCRVRGKIEILNVDIFKAKAF